MALKFDPMGGGMFKQAVKSIIEAERVPIKGLEARKGREEAKYKLFQEFKAKFTGFEKGLDEFTNFRKFRELKVDMGDGKDMMSVTVDKELAEPGTYRFKINQMAERSSVLSNNFADPKAKTLGEGWITFETVDGETKEVYVDSGHGSLEGISSLINQQNDAPVRASVIQDSTDADRPYRLILTSKKDGLDDSIEFPEFYFNDGREDFYIDDDHEGDNALVEIDGFDVELPGNNVSDFLKGVNLSLKQADKNKPFVLSITEDFEKVSGKVKALIEQLNGVLDFINKQNQVDEKSDTRSTFAGDSSLHMIEQRIRNIMHEGFPVGAPDSDKFRWVMLNEVGVEFDKTGKITLKEDKFKKALESDFEGLSEAFTGPFGFARQLKDLVSGYTRNTDGLLAIRDRGLQSRIKQIDTEIGAKEGRIQKREEALTAQFSRLQASLGAMQRQQQYVASALGGSAGGSIEQLLGGMG